MTEPTAQLQAVRASTADLLEGVRAEGWSDEDLRVASLCPGWTRGHVLSHLARNADGIAATLAGAVRGEIVPRYAPGTRDASIEAGAGRSLSAMLTDLSDSAERLDRVFGAVTEAAAWSAPTDDDVPAAVWVERRLNEVEVHRVDLSGAYGPDRWPPLLVAERLPQAATTVQASEPVRLVVAAAGSVVPSLAGSNWTIGTGAATLVEAPDWALLAWLIGRGSAAGAALPEDLPALVR